jgi:hypothetical protein
MANSARRDLLRELALLMRAPEVGSNNLGEFVAANADELAQVLGVDATRLEAARAVDDAVVAPHIRRLLDRARDRHHTQDLERRRQRSLEAAHRLGATVRWTDLGAELDVDLLLGELLADRMKKWIEFNSKEVFGVLVPRHLVAAAAPLRRVHIDLASFVNDKGLHVRWRGGRGGYDWYPHQVDARFADQVLAVQLPPRRVQVPERRRGGAWLKHILREIGYVV